MGVAALGVCHASALDAAIYTCGTLYPTGPLTVGSSVVEYQCGAANATTVAIRSVSIPVGGGSATIVNHSLPFVGTACDVATFSNNPFNLSLAEGALVASAVLAVWGIAACWRELAAFINQGGNSNEDLK